MLTLYIHSSPLLTFWNFFLIHPIVEISDFVLYWHPYYPYNLQLYERESEIYRARSYFQVVAFPEDVENCRCIPVSVLISFK